MTSAWDDRVRAHHEAVARFTEAAAILDDVAWHARSAPDKWCPGQVAEHVALTYERLVAELTGTGSGMKARLPFWKTTLLRWRVLPGILSSGVFPRARAVREIRPPDAPRAKATVLPALEGDAIRFETELSRARRSGGGSLTHPYFGRLRAETMLALMAAHTEHHRKQLPGA